MCDGRLLEVLVHGDDALDAVHLFIGVDVWPHAHGDLDGFAHDRGVLQEDRLASPRNKKSC